MRVDRRGHLLAAPLLVALGLSSLIALSAVPASPAQASEASRSVQPRAADARQVPARRTLVRRAVTHRLECVPFARQISGIDITGNAHTWWRQAEGRYQRGRAPEQGAVLVFRPSGGMRLGHVSVVSSIVSERHVLVDHANWPGPGFPKGRVARDVSMLDVSTNNDWSSVRVEIHGDRDGFGRVYPTFGFVYARLSDGSAPPPLQPTSTARAILDARAAAAAARPANYVGRGFNEATALVAALSDAKPARTPVSAAIGRPAQREAPAATRVAFHAPREALVDDSIVFAAPDRSLR